MSAGPVAARSSMRVHCRNFIVKQRGRHSVTAATMAYSNLLGGRVISGTVADSPATINAELVHGDEQAFWLEKRVQLTTMRRDMPFWDRAAQTAILMTRRVARVPQEAAFRLMAVYLKMLMMVQLVDLSSMMLPVWMSHNVQGLLGSELEKKNGDGEPKKEGAEGAAKDAAAAPAAAAGDAPPTA